MLPCGCAVRCGQDRSWKATPMVPRPAWAPMTGPIWPTTMSLVGERPQLVDERVDVAAVGVQHGEVLHAARGTPRPCRRGRPAPCERVRCLPCCSTTPSATSMIGLIDSAVASSALALPMRPPLRRLSSVSRAPNTRVRATSSRACGSTASRSPPAAAALGAGQGDRAEAERHRAAVDDAHVDAVGGDGAGGQLGALHASPTARRRG